MQTIHHGACNRPTTTGGRAFGWGLSARLWAWGAAAACGLLLAGAAGCGSEPPPKKGAKKAAVKEETAAAGTAKDSSEPPPPWKPEKPLPELADEPLPPLDMGRVSITLPKDWKVQPRSAQYLVMLLKAGDRQYPRIMVTAEDGPEAGFTPGNIDAEREALQADAKLAKSRQGPVRVCVIGGRPGLYYRQQAQNDTGTHLDLVTFLAAVDGRRYQLQLRAIRDEIGDDDMILAAMAAKIAFPKASN